MNLLNFIFVVFIMGIICIASAYTLMASGYEPSDPIYIMAEVFWAILLGIIISTTM